MSPHRTLARLLPRLAAATTVAAALTLFPQPPAGATPAHLNPAELSRGAAPDVAYLVHDTIRDGDRRVSATQRGDHEALWVVSGGYLVRDVNVGPRRMTRVVHISPAGERRVVARSRHWLDVAVSTSGRWVAVQRSPYATGLRTVVAVSRARTGDVVARRELRLATLVAVTGHRVLLGRRVAWHHPATVWWSYRRDTLARVYHQAAVSADLRHDTVVFNRSSVGEFCNRVAVLSRPSRTLWHSCRVSPLEWSPDGKRAIATHTYFDAAGTNRWWVIDGQDATRLAGIAGRLDWHATWEDSSHFLTLAQSDSGRAAVVRCDLRGTCQRASRLWNVPVPDDVYYAAPPVVLASR